jgi:hypothetical protein
MSGAVPQLHLYDVVACRVTALLFITTTIGITAAFLYSKDRTCQFLTRLYIACLPNRIAVSRDVSRCGVWCIWVRKFRRNVMRPFLCATIEAAGTHLLSRSALQNITFHIRRSWYIPLNHWSSLLHVWHATERTLKICNVAFPSVTEGNHRIYPGFSHFHVQIL